MNQWLRVTGVVVYLVREPFVHPLRMNALASAKLDRISDLDEFAD